MGDVGRAEAFYGGIVGLDVVRRRGGATFMSSGSYHHHIGANTWRSPGAGQRETDGADTQAALAARLEAAGVVTASGAEGLEFADPWGTRIRLVRG